MCPNVFDFGEMMLYCTAGTALFILLVVCVSHLMEEFL